MNTISLDGCQYPAPSSLPLNLSLLQEVIAAIPDLIYIADLVNDCNVYVNHRMTEILAYTEADVQAMDAALLSLLLHPEDHTTVARQRQQLAQAASGEVVTMEVRVRHASGDWCWLAIREVAFRRDEQGHLQQVLGIAQDITSRKHKEAEETLRQYRHIVSASPESLSLIDRHYIYRIVNDAYLKRTMRSYDEIVGHSVAEVMGADVFAHVIKEKLDRCMQGEKIRYSSWFVHAGEGRRFMDVTYTPYRNEQGDISGIVVSARDISHFKHIEEALRVSEEHFRLLFDQSPVGIGIVALDYRLVRVNDAFCRITGYARNELLALSFRDITHPDDTVVSVAQVDRLLTGKIEQFDIDKRYIRKDQQVVWVHLSVRLLRDVEGKRLQYLVAVEDITERKLLEEKLLDWNIKLEQRIADRTSNLVQSEARYRTLVETSPDAILMTDRDGRILFCNQQTATLLGYASRNEVVGRSYKELVIPEFSDQGQLPQHLPPSRTGCTQEMMLCRADGSHFPAEVHSSLVEDIQDKQRVIIMIIRNLTEHRYLQARMLAAEQLATGGRLTASIAHEMNTPLQALQNFLELSQKAPEHNRQYFLTSAIAEMQRIGHIVSQLLDIYQPHNDRPGVVDMCVLLERTLLLLRRQAKEQKVRIVSELTTPTLVWGNPYELTQVLLNIIINALDAMPNGGTLTLQTRVTDQQAAISIEDTGDGISPEWQEHIFEPFVTMRNEVAGLGLHISQQIIQKHGGSLLLESTPGVGSTFTLTLPAASARARNPMHEHTLQEDTYVCTYFTGRR
jgi:PAS domain S-box-containing protein